ncbi:long-chain fatty acid transport protein [Thiogranum longum]|uniref:Long-chain fatty acid transport protein n=1 Tax=Thiogranum longum TaxID=1537524 RepID=A0A4R1HB32_9GAMM|nr:outer membrane protein transport protein [Thiogranum longum]TCK17405.1 long-chain fatty acid transport protein [Thiogranum longum]
MKPILKGTLTSAAVAAALITAPLANATNGYFKIGYGSKNRGMAGAGMAFGQDSLAAAVNPAALAGMGNRVDAGVELFSPSQRESEVDARGLLVGDLGNGIRQGMESREDSGATLFAVPNFGLSMDGGGNMTFGLSVVANGGMNTRYGSANGGTGNIFTTAFAPVIGDTSTGAFQPGGPSGFAGALEVGAFGPPVPAAVMDPNLAALYLNPNTAPSLGVNLSQLLITPTIAYKINANNSVGFSPIIAYQRFRAYGVGLFQAFSSDPGKVTNNGDDESWGYGARVGYQGTFGMFSIGASYTSKLNMEAFDDYAGLFAEKGDFDIPSTYGVGIAIHPSSKLTIAADVTRINYSDVAAINNDGPTADEFMNAFVGALVGNPAAISNPLGTNDGWGFGWDDITVYKVGINYMHNSKWTFRAGYNFAEVPYDEDQALFNVLAPAVVEKHATVGFTYNPSTTSELTVAYMHAFRNSVDYDYNGTGGFAGFGFSAENAMSQNSVEASYAWKF